MEKSKILVVDDRPENLLAMTNILEDLPVQTFTAESGEQALEMMLENNFALVLLDVQMPGMDGFETAELMRGSRKTKNIPIIFVTAINKDEEHVFRGYEAGAVDYLFKPINVRLLTSKVKIFLELYQQKQKLQSANLKLHDSLSKRIAVEQSLRQSENRYRDTLNAISTIMITINQLYVIKFWNKAAQRETGLSELEIFHQNLFKKAPYLSPLRTDIKLAFEQNRIIERYKFEIKKKKNETKYINVQIVPFLYNDEQCVTIQISDITELVKKENQLIQAQKMETVGNLAGGLAHDFNNVLGGITGTVSLIKYELQKPNAALETVRNYIDIVSNSAKRAGDMVQQLLTLSRKQNIIFVPVDLNSSLRHTYKICKNTFDKSIKLSYRTVEDYATVQADPTQIEQVLLNLCINASHAMTIMRDENEQQGGSLDLSIFSLADIQDEIPEIIQNKKSDYWILQIQDTGVGIPQEYQQKIFDPFFTTKDKQNGTGLGLAMVYNIVEQHGGILDLHSEVGLGTRFRLFFPKFVSDNNLTKEDKEVFIPKGHGKILVIDDEHIIRETVKSILNECGYETCSAINGVEGLKQYKQFQEEIRLVILDMAMPEKNGLETYKELKVLNPDIKVLLASGFKMDERVKKAMDLGVTDFLQKPFTMESLSQKVKAILK